ncbi:enhanced serine sensitivity protein SseB C-terminal domain-containing protein [Rickettsiella endosymbiont of Xylota segnis]|uniref:enhanced serine sensitivity protein SseB C-terminal domain-containing protein n=1 Tax=Rickettsiella endosymbiont of Xylota segnis TaxID=3066238 RepID=UPI0030CDFDDF
MQKHPLLIGKPRIYPAELAKQLVDFFKKKKDVRTAYLAQVYDPISGEPPHLTIGIVMDVQIDSIAYELKKIVQTTCQENEFIDFMHVDTPEKAELFSSVEPFYVS